MIASLESEDMAHNDYGAYALNELHNKVISLYNTETPVSGILQVTTLISCGSKPQREQARREILNTLLSARLNTGMLTTSGQSTVIPFLPVRKGQNPPKFYYTTSSRPENVKMDYMRLLISDLNRIIAQRIENNSPRFTGITQATVVFMLSKPLDFLQPDFVPLNDDEIFAAATEADAEYLDDQSDTD